MTSEVAHRTVDKILQSDSKFVNDMLLGKVKPLMSEHYSMERGTEHLSKSV